MRVRMKRKLLQKLKLPLRQMPQLSPKRLPRPSRQLSPKQLPRPSRPLSPKQQQQLSRQQSLHPLLHLLPSRNRNFPEAL